MVTRWLLKRAVQQFQHQGAGRFGVQTPEQFLQLAGISQVVLPSLQLFYTGEAVVRQYFAVQDQMLATKERVLHLAASLAQHSGQPLLLALPRALQEQGLQSREVEVDVLSNVGVIGKLDRTWYILGDATCMQQEQMEIGLSVMALAQQMEAEGMYVLFLAQKQPKRLLGIFACSYPLLSESAEIMMHWYEAQLTPRLYTSAPEKIARGIASSIGIAECSIFPTLQAKHQALKKSVQESGVAVIGGVPGAPCVLHLGKEKGIWVQELQDVPACIQQARERVAALRKTAFWAKL